MSMYTAGDVRKLKRERDELLAALRLMYAMATTTTPKVGEMDVALDAAAVIHQKAESELQGHPLPGGLDPIGEGLSGSDSEAGETTSRAAGVAQR